jgi:hypothetical protein
MHKIDADRLSIIAYGDEEEPSENIQKLETIDQDIRNRLKYGDYGSEWLEEGKLCWILQPGEQWKRGKLKISFEVYIDDSLIKTDENTSLLDDLRNLNDEQP